MEMYFCFQLGVHIYSVFELVVIKKKDKKYYEWMLHHFMAASLILFSMMCNEITAGVMILIVHDASDIFMAGSRVYFEAHFKKYKPVTGFMVFILFFSWIYLRIVVFPFCLLSNVYVNKPEPTDEWYIIHWEYLYLLCMAFVLFGMHLYWTYCLIKSAVISFSKEKIVNDFDEDKRK
jgi:ceramide synthetase